MHRMFCFNFISVTIWVLNIWLSSHRKPLHRKVAWWVPRLFCLAPEYEVGSSSIPPRTLTRTL